MQGVPDKQVPLPDTLLNFQYMYNSTGSKVSPGHCAIHWGCCRGLPACQPPHLNSAGAARRQAGSCVKGTVLTSCHARGGFDRHP